MAHDVVRVVLASDVAPAGTFTVGYPTGRNAGSYELGGEHFIQSNKYGPLWLGVDFTVSFGTSSVTVTNATAVTLEAGSELWVQFDRPGADDDLGVGLPGPRVGTGRLVVMSLGAADVADPDGICKSQSATGAVALTMNGDLVSGGVAELDVPRALVVDSGGADTAVIIITGEDEYGAPMEERITLNGTTAVFGKKAFKRVTGVAQSATTANGVFVGTTDILGLPCFISDVGRIMRELEDGVAATAGTVVAGSLAEPSATTGDVRGTYDPNTAMDGEKAITLFALVDDPMFLGKTQYAG